MTDDNKIEPESEKPDDGEGESVVITKPAPIADSEPSDDTSTADPTNQNPLMSYFEEGDTEDKGDQKILVVADDSPPSGQELGVGQVEPAKDTVVNDEIHETVRQEVLKSEQSAGHNVLMPTEPPNSIDSTKDESKEGTCQKETSKGGDTQTSEVSETTAAPNAKKPTIAALPPLPPPPPPPRNLSKKKSSKPRASHSDSKANKTADSKPSTKPEQKEDLVAEAQRQAAIAAAISANSTAMSPSVAAGLAKVLALPGVMSETLTSVGEGIIDALDVSGTGGSSAGGSPTTKPLPRVQQASRPGGYQSGPTMVALPPMPPPHPLKKKGRGMKPVRMKDVKVAFALLMNEEESKKCDSLSLKGEDTGVRQVGTADMSGPTGAENTTVDELKSSIDNISVDGADSIASEPKISKEDNANQSSSESGSIGKSDEAEGVEIRTAAAAAATLGANSKSSIDEATKRPEQEEETNLPIPEPFLRFLLLVARVPIVVEESNKRNRRSIPAEGKVPKEANVAAKRAHEILCLIRTSYEEIEIRRRNLDSGDSEKKDATSSFFAACAGELVEDEDDMDVIESALPAKFPRRVASNTNLPTAAAASTLATSVLSNVMTKMSISSTERKNSFSDMFGKKLSSIGSLGNGSAVDRSSRTESSSSMRTLSLSSVELNSTGKSSEIVRDYEVLISQEMLGLTVENVLERTVIRTILQDGAAKHAGAKVGSLIAKVGNVDTSSLTHFETIDELRQSKRPLKLTLRNIGEGTLRKAREEMGRLIRGRGESETVDCSRLPTAEAETFDTVLSNRWPSKLNQGSSSSVSGSNISGNISPRMMTRAESIHFAGKELIRILSLLVVGLTKELAEVQSGDSDEDHSETSPSLRQHPSVKELNEAIEITSKVLSDFARGHPDVVDKSSRSSVGAQNKPAARGAGSSFYPVPPGRVQGKKSGAPPPPKRGGRNANKKPPKPPSDTPILRIGDALQRTRSFLVETTSTSARALRWEIIDHLCSILDMDTEQELAEKESSEYTSGDSKGANTSPAESSEGTGPTNDLGSAGSILKLIVLNCSTNEPSTPPSTISDDPPHNDDESDEDILSRVDSESSKSTASGVDNSFAGNVFLSVVHRLAASKSTSARVTACSLGPVLWLHLDFPRQLLLRGVITRALHDVEVIVRKSTAIVLHEIAEMVFDRRSVPWLVLMCERTQTDPEPLMRGAAMTLTWHLAEHLPNAFWGDKRRGSRSIRRLPPRNSPMFMDVYLLQCKLLPVASNLAEDRVATVRLSVAAQSDRLCKALGEHWFNVIIDLLQALLSDGDERVRSEAVLCMPRFVESVVTGSSQADKNDRVLESLLPQALRIQNDASAQVRSSLATAAGELLVLLVGLGGASNQVDPPLSPGRVGPSSDEGTQTQKHHNHHVDDTLIPILQKMLQDPDPSVVTASLRAVTNASRSSAPRHRSESLSRSLTPRHEPSIDDDLISISSHQSSHTVQSQLSFEPTRPVFIPVLSENQVLRLLPTLSSLSTSPKWRVRQSAVEIVPALLGCTRRHETRQEISKLCLTLMSDKVDAVRNTAAECLCLGGGSLARHGEDDGGEWTSRIVVPHLRSCSESKNSRQRMLTLKMVEIIITNGLCPATTRATPGSPVPLNNEGSSSPSSIAETLSRKVLAVASSLIDDKVANVRLNVGRVFGSIMYLLERSDVDYVVDKLEKQLDLESKREGGADRDVLFYAQQAIVSAQTLLRREPSIS